MILQKGSSERVSDKSILSPKHQLKQKLFSHPVKVNKPKEPTIITPFSDILSPTLTKVHKTDYPNLERLAKPKKQLTPHIKSVALTMSNQNVIKSDCERTQLLPPEFTLPFQQILTYFCSQSQITYKQGINEVLAPFFHLAIAKAQKIKSRRLTSASKSLEVGLEEPYLQMERFVKRFQTSFFVNQDFNALHLCLSLLKLLLKYHEPELFKYLEAHGVSNELYAIPWFITYLATKFADVEVLLEFWDRIVGKDDPTFVFFFLVALIAHNSVHIMSTDPANLPVVMSGLRICSHKELTKVWIQAEELSLRTPHSFVKMQAMHHLFSGADDGTLLASCLKLDKLPCLPLTRQELLYYAFPGEIECPDPTCLNSANFAEAATSPKVSCETETDAQDPFAPSALCTQCSQNLTASTKHKSSVQIVIVDCRFKSLQLESKLPVSLGLKITNTAVKEQIVDQVDSLNDYKDIFHIALIGLDILELEPDKGRVTLRQFHAQVIQIVADTLAQRGFKYVSVLPEGFQVCHDFVIHSDFELLYHKKSMAQEKCYHCGCTQETLSKSRKMYQSMKYLSPESESKSPNKHTETFNLMNFTNLLPSFEQVANVAHSIKLNFFSPLQEEIASENNRNTEKTPVVRMSKGETFPEPSKSYKKQKSVDCAESIFSRPAAKKIPLSPKKFELKFSAGKSVLSEETKDQYSKSKSLLDESILSQQSSSSVNLLLKPLVCPQDSDYYLSNGIPHAIDITEQELQQLRYEHQFFAVKLQGRSKTAELSDPQVMILSSLFALVVVSVMPGITVLQKFQMHDLIKITQKKEDAKVISFYFRIPTVCVPMPRERILQSLGLMPPSDYQFTNKRAEGTEVMVSFKFDSDEQVQKCIDAVGGLYKKLKIVTKMKKK